MPQPSPEGIEGIDDTDVQAFIEDLGRSELEELLDQQFSLFQKHVEELVTAEVERLSARIHKLEIQQHRTQQSVKTAHGRINRVRRK